MSTEKGFLVGTIVSYILNQKREKFQPFNDLYICMENN